MFEHVNKEKVQVYVKYEFTPLVKRLELEMAIEYCFFPAN